jgi:geranylgeranyl reductase family protein
MRSVTTAVDVLVVGLGPAGACAAAEAARGGARVVAIDRKSEAGMPVQCAEFVPRLIGMEVGELIGARCQDITSMTTFLDRTGPHVQDRFPGVMIDRVRFDAALVEEARDAGAALRLGVNVRGFDDDGAAVLSDGSRVGARVIVGADGPRSVVGKAVGAENSEIAETRQMQVPLLEPFEATDIFLSSAIPGGYAWLFPKDDVANLGVGIASTWRADLKPLLAALHEELVSEGRVGREVISHTGGAIPVGGMRRLVSQLGAATVLLAGDAAGLTNPVTGAGITSAVISGRLAGEAAAKAARGFADAADDYADEIVALYGSSLARALERRAELLAAYTEGRTPTAAELKRGWIAFPEYWA